MVLTNGLKITDITKKNFLQLKFPHYDDQRWSSYRRADFSSVWDPLASWLC